MSDSICMSSYKAATQGTDHKRIPKDVAENTIIIGHEFAGEIVEVGVRWQHKFKPVSYVMAQSGTNANVVTKPGIT